MDERIIELIGKTNLEKLKSKNILLVGIGGVGGTTLETLVRSGIQNITIIDKDTFEASNLNRQIIGDTTTLGTPKVEVANNRYKKINPNINLVIKNMFLSKDNISEFKDFDYIIDACDTISTKIELIKYAINNNIKIICCMGVGKRLDPTKVKLTTLDKTFNDPLSKVMRKELKNYNLKKINVVFSEELPINNNETIASMMMVPSTAGIYLAYYIINDIIKE